MDALVKVDIIVNTLSRSQQHFSMTRTHKSTKPHFYQASSLPNSTD